MKINFLRHESSMISLVKFRMHIQFISSQIQLFIKTFDKIKTLKKLTLNFAD